MHRAFVLLLLVVSATASACHRSEETVRADKPCVCPSVASATVEPIVPTALELPSHEAKVTTLFSVAIDAKGAISVAGKPMTRAELETEARVALAKDPTVRVVIAADSHAEHGQVIAVVDLLKTAGITKIAFAVNKVGDAGAP